MEEDPDNAEMWLTWNDHAQIFKDVMSTLRYRELYADVTLVCCEKQYAVHKFILSTCSAFFEKLLETIPGQHPVVVLTNMSPKELESLLDFMYLGQAEVNSQDLDRLLDIAFEFRIRGLINPRYDAEKEVHKDENETREEVVTSENVVDSATCAESNQVNRSVFGQDYEDMNDREREVEEGEPKLNGPIDGTAYNSDLKTEEDVKPPALDSGLKEYQNFIQKLMQEAEEAETLEVTPLANLTERPHSTVKRVSKHQDEKCKKSKFKGRIEKHKTDIRKHKEKTGNGRTDSSKEKTMARKDEDTKTRIMMCPGCKKTFMNRSVLEEHMKTHKDLEIISCTKCPHKALNKLQMEKHLMSHQQNIDKMSRPFHCPYCPARQMNKSSFVRHQKTLHPDKKVMNMSPKVEHTRTHQMMCPGCKKTFMNRSILVEHLNKHKDLEIVSCTMCPHKALNKLQMEKHLMYHQQNQ